MRGAMRRPDKWIIRAAVFTALVLLGYAQACTRPGTLLLLKVNDAPASPTFPVPASAGVYFVNFTLGVPLGGKPLTIAPQAPHLTALTAGCSQVIVSFGAGAAA